MKTYTETNEKKLVAMNGRSFKMFIKIFSYSIIFTVMGFIFVSCAGGYVTTEPTYDMSYDRPVSPGEAYIWINGEWRWDRGSRNYVHDRGYWIQPRQGRTYREGHWESGPKGKYWTKGYWERSRSDQAVNNKKRDHDHNRNRDNNHDHN